MNNGLLGLLVFLIAGATVPDQSLGQSPSPGENPIIITPRSEKFEIVPHQVFQMQLELSLPKEYRAYSDKFKVEIIKPEGFKVGKLTLNPEIEFFDKFSNKVKKGMVGTATLSVTLEASEKLTNAKDLEGVLTYQACTDTYCLFPTKKDFKLPLKFTDERSTSVPSSDKKIWDYSFQDALSKGLLWAFIVSFLAGFLTSLTPCVFPLIPITISVLGRHSHLHSKRKNLLLSHLYVLGIATTYAAIGIFAAATGSLFGSFMNHPVVLTVICVVFLTMALGMFGAFEFQAPAFLRQRLSGDLHIHGYHSAYIYGIIAGVIAGPCVGPVLVGILTFVAQSQNLWLGFWLLFVFALGMGQLFLLIGVSSQFTKLLPKSGPWMDFIKNIFGVMMLGVFFYYLSLLVPIRIWDFIMGIVLIGFASWAGAFIPIQQFSFAASLKKGFLQALIFIGASFIVLSIFNLRPILLMNRGLVMTASPADKRWIPYSETALQDAIKNKKPVIIDFWAEWCAACLELEKYTFTHPQFQSATQNFVLLKYDATKPSKELDELRKKYSIVGLPSLIIYDSTGTFRKDLTVTEFVEAPALLPTLKKALNP